MKALFGITFMVFIIFVCMNPPRTATVRKHDGSIVTAHISGIVGKVSVNETRPMFETLTGQYVIGTGNELAKTEEVKIITVESTW